MKTFLFLLKKLEPKHFRLLCLQFPDIKSSNPPIRAFLLTGYMLCFLLYAIWQPFACARCGGAMIWKHRRYCTSSAISIWGILLKWKCRSASLCSVMDLDCIVCDCGCWLYLRHLCVAICMAFFCRCFNRETLMQLEITIRNFSVTIFESRFLFYQFS